MPCQQPVRGSDRKKKKLPASGPLEPPQSAGRQVTAVGHRLSANHRRLSVNRRRLDESCHSYPPAILSGKKKKCVVPKRQPRKPSIDGTWQRITFGWMQGIARPWTPKRHSGPALSFPNKPRQITEFQQLRKKAWSPRSLPLLAATCPQLDGLSEPFGQQPSVTWPSAGGATLGVNVTVMRKKHPPRGTLP